ncbi:AAA family ATPase [Streptomyces sp. NPDC001728]|uniref:AAA family ATPase n=1 Tax=Streptomyces sp. NPDC001728 TaxID=3154396 RepID=UPI00331E4C90
MPSLFESLGVAEDVDPLLRRAALHEAAGDPESAASDRTRARDTARHAGLSAPERRPVRVTAAGEAFAVVSGPPASGKSTLAHALTARLGLPLVDKDVILESLYDSLGVGDQARRHLPRPQALNRSPW